ncbi:unnamed protein product [Phaedon cochleariae]|uniref:Uncharacterized protein n=1 Tax=Phaedon cochleariae TaxID=80249 RepID=A0A9N9X1Z2_PHACE|nr:unnamed protein product [Phaedon cochleariae]
MSRAVFVIFMVAFVGFSLAQVNFSPNWGKRAMNQGDANENNNCRENMDTIMLIYKIIQNEAQKLLECEKFSN